MADEQPKKRRSLKAPQTVRERVETTRVSDAKPSKLGPILSAVAKPFKIIGRVLAKPGRYIVPPYFRNAAIELKQVTWPNRKQSRQLTTAVIIFAVIFGVLVALVDYGLDKVFKKVILKQ